MSEKELKRILVDVRRLSPAERRTVVLAIKAQDGEGASTTSQKNANDWLLPGLEFELKRRGLLVGALSAEHLHRFAPNYSKEASVLLAKLKVKFKQRPTQAELLSFGRVCARSLADFIVVEKLGDGFRTLGPKVLLQHVPDLPQALERSFPGYLAAGTLAALVRMV